MGLFGKDKNKEQEAGTDTEQESSPFPDIVGTEPEPEVDTETPSPVTVEELNMRFDDYVKESEAREQRYLELLTKQNQPTVVTQAPIEEETKFNRKDIPDYVEDPNGYATAIEDNTVGRVEQILSDFEKRTASTTRSTNIYNQVWTEFNNKHGDLAKHSEFVESHSKRIFNDLRSQGVDVENYLLNNKDAFMSNLSTSVTSRLKELGIDQGSSNQEQPESTTSANRTGGIPSATSGGTTSSETQEEQGGFVNQIKNSQKTMGLI